MKKVLSIILVLTLMVAVFAGCSSKDATSGDAAPENDGSGIVKIGLGHVTSIAKSKDLGTDAEGKDVLPVGQVDTVIVAAAFDKDGKVVKVSIDQAQTKVNFDKELQVTSDLAGEYKTKVELGEEYGMIKASSIKKEWFEQAAALGDWMKGKTVEEIEAMKVKEKDEEHPAIPDEADLTSSVTVSVQEFIEAIKEAYDNSVEIGNGAVKLGLGHETSIAKSHGLGEKDGKEVLPLAEVDTMISVTAVDKDGKVVGTIIDQAQTKVDFDKDGKVTTDRNGEFKTKVELGDEYGMLKQSSIKKNWDEQVASLQQWMIGKTEDEIKGMKVKARDDAHPAVPDEADLTSSVTISVGEQIASVAEAIENAK